MAHLTTGQIGQLIEIDKAGQGIRDEVQELIKRLTSGGVGVKSDDPRVVQAKQLWDRALFGHAQGFNSFKDYLATIPEIPTFPESYADRFPLLVLVDARLPVVRQCPLLGVNFSGDDQTFVDYERKTAKTGKVYWIRAQDGRKNNGKSAHACREAFGDDEVGLSALEGLAIYAQNPDDLKGRAMELPGSVRRGRSNDRTAFLTWIDAGLPPMLHCGWDGNKSPDSGTASRGK